MADQRDMESVLVFAYLGEETRGDYESRQLYISKQQSVGGVCTRPHSLRLIKTRLPGRIALAEKALALRARELFYVAGEEQALDDTMYALHALRNTSQTSHCI